MASVNYDDKRFTEVKNQEATAVRETEGKYDNMINQTDSFYEQQIDASKDWANKQSEIQQAQTDFAIEKVEQQKDKAHKDYIKEQKGAYADYQEAINPYGANAEKLASQGLLHSGYSESVKTNMFNTYQNRYMAARESYTQAILNYDNAIKEAQLANNAQLAQIAYEALQKQLELSLQGFQYKNQLVLQKLEAVNQQKDRYYQRYQDVLQQINTENAMAEQVRQFNEKMAFEKQQAAQAQANWQKEYNLAVSSRVSSGSSGGSGGSTKTSTSKSSSDSSKSSSGSTKTSTSNSSSKSSSTKTQQAPATRTADGKTWYQDATSAISAAGYSAYSAEGALKKGIIESRVINGTIYFAPAKTNSNSQKSSVNRPVQSTSNAQAIMQYGRYLDL